MDGINGMHTQMHETFWTAFCGQEIVSILFCFCTLCLKRSKTGWISIIFRGSRISCQKGVPSRTLLLEGDNCTHLLPDSATEGKHFKGDEN